jgi:predicted ribosomally synthesized peptide with nif11-like leader
MEFNQKVKDFLIKLGEDEELRGKLEAAGKRQDLAECALLSREAGFDFTRADLEYMADLAQACQNGELSDEQLELVSGGVATAVVVLGIVVALGSVVVLMVSSGAAGYIINELK